MHPIRWRVVSFIQAVAGCHDCTSEEISELRCRWLEGIYQPQGRPFEYLFNPTELASLAGLHRFFHDGAESWLQVLAKSEEVLSSLGWTDACFDTADGSDDAWPPGSMPSNPVSDWSSYYESTLEKPLHPLYDELDKYLPTRGLALEIGCGVGHGVLHLANKGLIVSALDGQIEALDILRKRIPANLVGRIHCQQSLLEALDLAPEHFDVIVAGFCLFFISPALFPSVWRNIAQAIRPGGLFMGQFLGPNDSWSNRGFSLHTKDEVQELLKGFEILSYEEAERDGTTSQGTEKHWHVHHVIARKHSR